MSGKIFIVYAFNNTMKLFIDSLKSVSGLSNEHFFNYGNVFEESKNIIKNINDKSFLALAKQSGFELANDELTINNVFNKIQPLLIKGDDKLTLFDNDSLIFIFDTNRFGLTLSLVTHHVDNIDRSLISNINPFSSLNLSIFSNPLSKVIDLKDIYINLNSKNDFGILVNSIKTVFGDNPSRKEIQDLYQDIKDALSLEQPITANSDNDESRKLALDNLNSMFSDIKILFKLKPIDSDRTKQPLKNFSIEEQKSEVTVDPSITDAENRIIRIQNDILNTFDQPSIEQILSILDVFRNEGKSFFSLNDSETDINVSKQGVNITSDSIFKGNNDAILEQLKKSPLSVLNKLLENLKSAIEIDTKNLKILQRHQMRQEKSQSSIFTSLINIDKNNEQIKISDINSIPTSIKDNLNLGLASQDIKTIDYNTIKDTFKAGDFTSVGADLNKLLNLTGKNLTQNSVTTATNIISETQSSQDNLDSKISKLKNNIKEEYRFKSLVEQAIVEAKPTNYDSEANKSDDFNISDSERETNKQERNVIANNSNLPRAIRNNNPGNVKDTGDQWIHMLGIDDGGHLVFDDAVYGYRCLAIILNNTYFSKGKNTISKIFAEYSEANKSQYANFVSNYLKVGKDTILDYNTHAQKLMEAITIFETDSNKKITDFFNNNGTLITGYSYAQVALSNINTV